MSGKKIDITGQRFGRLVAVSEVEPNGVRRRWLCKCDCGNEKTVDMYLLRQGRIKSCGCIVAERSAHNQEDISGQRFGRLVVIRRAKVPGQSPHQFWECRCDCGNTTIANVNNLRNGTTRSCGCLLVENGHKVQEWNKENEYQGGVFIPALRKKIAKNNTTGVKGVCYNSRTGMYRAQITIKRKKYFLGEYQTLEEAAAARKRGEEIYHKPYLEDGKTPPST